MSNILHFQKPLPKKTPLQRIAELEAGIQENLREMSEIYSKANAEGEASDLYQHFSKTFEKLFLQRMLEVLQGDVKALAALIKLDRFTLQKRCKQHGIQI